MAHRYEAGRPQWDGERIRALRRHLGLTQREMADRLGSKAWSELVSIYTPEKLEKLNDDQLLALQRWEALQNTRIKRGYPHLVWTGFPC